MTIISVKNLKKTFGTNRVLRDIDVEINEGEIVVVVGSSGSGKSTFLRCLNLLEEPTAGEIVVDGVKITDRHVNLNALRQTIGMVFQQFNLFPNLSVIENIKLAPKKLRKFSDQKATKLARGLLDDVGLLDKADASPDSLSGGQKQRVAIARALSNSPDLMLADEPTGALDTATGRMVMDLFHDLNQNHGVTIALITHNPELAEETTRIVTMNDGILTGPPAPQNGIVPAVMLAPATGPFTAITPDDIAAAEAEAAAAQQSPTNAPPAVGAPTPKPTVPAKPTAPATPKVPAKPKVKKAKSKSQRHSTTQGQSGEAWRGVTTGTGTGTTGPRFGRSGRSSRSASDPKTAPGGDN